MAYGRILNARTPRTQAFADLHQATPNPEFAQLLEAYMNSNTDDHGRLPGHPFEVKSLVLPNSPRSADEFAEALRALDQVGLIDWYEGPDGHQWIQINDHDETQAGLKRRSKSKIPASPKRCTAERSPADTSGQMAIGLGDMEASLREDDLGAPAMPGSQISHVSQISQKSRPELELELKVREEEQGRTQKQRRAVARTPTVRMGLGRSESHIRRALHCQLVAHKDATDEDLFAEARRVIQLLPKSLPDDDDTLRPVIAAVREARRTRGHAEQTALDPNVRRLAHLAGLSTDEAIVCLEGATLRFSQFPLGHELLVPDAEKAELIRQHCLAALRSAMPRMFQQLPSSAHGLRVRHVPHDESEATA